MNFMPNPQSGPGAQGKSVPFSEPTHFVEAETSVRQKHPGEVVFTLTDWALVVFDGVHLGRLFPLTNGENTIGRSELVHVALFDAEVSRVHASLELETEGPESVLILRDEGSKNGTYLNGQILREPTRVQAGDRIGIGSHLLKVVALDTVERTFYEKLLDQSTKDGLTGLWNRNATMEELQARMLLAQRHTRPLTLVLCDLDWFKQVNDRYGHGAGDLVLSGFGNLVRQALRISDRAGRIGGEEFLLILPETDLQGAVQLAERLRLQIAAKVHTFQNGSTQVTCSFGVAECLSTDKDINELLARVDGALYRAKHAGRDRVVAAL